MMRRFEGARDFAPNLAPMVDVIMVLLVFFLLGASLNLVKQGVLQTELDPRSGPGHRAAVEVIPRIRIALRTAAEPESVRIFLMEEPLPENTFEGLRSVLLAKRRAGADADNMVVIGADTTVRWRYVVRAMDAAVQAGFKNVQFAVSFRPEGSAAP
jgi:biopolymer transport protein ExbD